MVHGKPFAGATEARHDLVAHHQDAVLRAQPADALQVAVGRDEHAVGAAHGLQKERGNRLRTFQFDDLLEHCQRLFRRVRSALEAVIGIEDVNDAGDSWLGAPASRVAGERHRTVGSAVVGTIPGKNLVAAGVRARDLHRVFVRLGTAVGEEEHVDVAGGQFGELGAELRARLGGHERVGVCERFRLRLDRANDPLVAVADVDAHQLAVEVEVALPLGSPEIDALGARHRNGVNGALRGPLEKRVLATEIDDVGARQRGQRRGHDSTCFSAAA